MNSSIRGFLHSVPRLIPLFILLVAGHATAQSAYYDIDVTLTWSRRVDLNLHVECPNGHDLSSGKASCPDGGLVIQTNRWGGTAGAPARERVVWPAGRASNGGYIVYARYVSTGADSGPVDCQVDITLPTRSLRYRCTLKAALDQVTMAMFTFPTAPAPLPFHVDGRSLYVWDDAYAICGGSSYTPSAGPALVTFCGQRRIARVYLLFKPGDMVYARVQDFCRLAHAASPPIRVYALNNGSIDNAWFASFPVFNDEAVLDWVRAVQSFNAASPADARFDGVSMDIEPHTSADWSTHKAEFLSAYCTLMARVKAQIAGALPLGAAIPFWWDNYTATYGGVTKPAYQHALDILDYASVMDYSGDDTAKVLSRIANECAYRPGRVELIQQTDPTKYEGGVAIFVSKNRTLEGIFRSALRAYGTGLMECIHKYPTYRDMPR